MNLGIPYVSPEMSTVKPMVHKCCHKWFIKNNSSNQYYE
jgi:hypothetical protein